MTTDTSLESILSHETEVSSPAPATQQEAPVVQAEPLANQEAPQPVSEAPKADEPPPGFMPYGAYKDEKTKRQEAERLAGERERELAQLRQALAQQQAQQPAQQPIDLFQDPEGYNRSIQEEIQRIRFETRLAQAQQIAFAKHGFAVVDEAERFVMSQVASNPTLEARVAAAPNRWEEAVKILNEHKLLQEIGQDPDSYRQRIIAEYEASRSNGQSPQAPQATTPQVLPSNIATSRGTSGRSEGTFEPTPLREIFKR